MTLTKCAPARRLCCAALFISAIITAFSLTALAQGGNPFLPPSATPHYARDRDYHVRHLKLVFDIDAVHHGARGVVTHYLAPLRDGLSTIDMDAGSNLQIGRVLLNGQPVQFTHTGETLAVSPGHPLARGVEVALQISYVMPGDSTGGGANGLGGFHWILSRGNAADRPPGFWTQGETETNHHWVPCYDYPNDKCTSETITTVPENWAVIGNGREVSNVRNPAAHTRTFHWVMTQPHSTYLLSLAGGELDVQHDSWAGVPLYYVVPKGEGWLIPGSFGNTPDMLQFFSTILGYKYAWPKYAESAMLDFGGGMENVSATTLGAFSLTDKRSGNYPMSSLNSHELAHQWFGDLVTCKFWGDIWLNESFATFFEMLYTEHLLGKDGYDVDREGALRQYLGEARRYKRPLSTHLYPSGDAMFDRHTYPKGGLILHMLRRELGDANFFRGLRHYLQVNQYRPVDSHDLSKAITVETGINVEPFFDQWIYKPGHPVIDSTWTYDEASRAVVVHIKQTQETSDGTPIYRLPLTIALLHSGSSGVVERHSFIVDKADQDLRIPAATRPDAVLTDPDHDLLMEIADKHWSDAELPVILRSAPSMLDRRDASTRYAGDGALDAGRIEVLADALRAETSDSEAAHLISLLAPAKDESLHSLMRDQAASRQPARKAEAIYALEQMPQNPQDMKIFRAAAMSDTDEWPVVLNGLSALGKFDTADNLDAFGHQIGVRSVRDRVGNRIVSILSDAKLDRSAPIVIAATGSIHAVNTRVDAISLLGKIAPGDPAVHTTLLAALKVSDRPDIQEEAARSLAERKDTGAVDALRTLQSTSTNADVKDAAKSALSTLTAH